MNEDNNKPPLPDIDLSSIGTWEKHTKGIGSKLLKKFGFKGRLGANEDGIATHIEVKARPLGQGLGFNNNDEDMIRKNDKKIDKNDVISKAEKGSRWGGIEKIAQSGSWRKGDKGRGGIDRVKPKVVTVADLLMKEEGNEKQTLIIDMRSRETRVLNNYHDIIDRNDGDDDGLFTSKAQLGTEFLFNLNQIYEQVQSEVERDSRSYSIHGKRFDSITLNIKEIEKQLETDQPRLERLEKIYKVLERVYETQQRSPESVTTNAIIRLLQTLFSSFTEEFRLFGIIHLLQSMTNPIIQSAIQNWEPLQAPLLIAELFSSWSSLISFFDDYGEASFLSDILHVRQTMVSTLIAPLVQRAITNSWDVKDPDACVTLIEGLKQVLDLNAFEQFIETVLVPKLTAAVEGWNPHEDVYLHQWLHPWLPLLGAKLSVVYPDIRRKISKRLGEWHPSDSTGRALLMPWIDIFDRSSLDNLVVRSIIPKLIVSIRGMPIDPCFREDGEMGGESQFQWDWIISWHGIIPQMHFISLLAGEFFPRWLLSLGSGLMTTISRQSFKGDNSTNGKSDLQAVVAWYLKWKSAIPQEILVDEEIIRYFNVALEMMAAALDPSPASSANRCIRGYMRSANELSYIRLMEMKRAKAEITEKLNKINQKPKSSSFSSSSTKFHEVVESFAAENDVEFYLTSRTSNDKKIYQFGKLEVYTSNNVIFCRKGDEFLPVGLDELLEANKGTSI